MDAWPLVGRDRALAVIARRVLAAEPASILLAGPAGVGKSRLAAEVLDTATGRGFVTLRATASESAATIPFGALARTMPAVGDVADEAELVKETRAGLLQSSAGRPVVLGVDDVHLLDTGSADLLAGLAAAGDLRLVATVRETADPPGALAALAGTVLTRVEVGPLSEQDTQRALEAVLGAPVSLGAAARLWQRSGGNPLFLRELVRETLADGSLSRESGAWLLAPGDAASPRLVEAVRRRFADLPQDAEHAVGLLALADVLSEPLLARLVPGLPLTALEERGLVVREVAGRRQELRLAHPVYGEVVRSAMPSIRRRRHHRELAAAVEDCGARRRDDVLRLATWSLDSSGTVAPERLVEAAEQAQRRFDLPLAQRLAEAAVDAGGGPPAFVLLAEVSFRRGELDRAVGLLARAADLAETDEHVASVADARAHVLDLSGRPGEAWEVLEEAQGRVSTPELVESLAGRAAVLMLFAGRMPEALAAVSRILAAAGGDRGALAPRQRLRCDYVEPIALALSGRGDEAVEVSTAGIAWLVASDVPYPVENLLIGRVLAHLLSGDLASAAEDAVAVERGFVAAGDVEGEATGRLLQGRVELARGDLAAARAHFEHAVALNRRLDDRIGLRWALGGLAAVAGMAGDDAGPVAAALTAMPGDPAWLFEPDLVARGLAWTARAEGRGRDAVVVAAAAADEAARRGQVLPELTLRHDLLRWGERDQAVRLSALAAASTGPWPAAVAMSATAVAAGSGSGHLAAADAFAAIGARGEEAASLAAAVTALRAEGRGRRADAVAVRLSAIDIVGVPPTALAAAAAALTRREREVAELAADRLTAAQIAERLGLSPRTVENHLQRVYAKLGVAGRAEMQSLLRGRSPGHGG